MDAIYEVLPAGAVPKRRVRRRAAAEATRQADAVAKLTGAIGAFRAIRSELTAARARGASAETIAALNAQRVTAITAVTQLWWDHAACRHVLPPEDFAALVLRRGAGGGAS